MCISIVHSFQECNHVINLRMKLLDYNIFIHSTLLYHFFSIYFY